MPASWRVRAAFKPAMPPPMIAIAPWVTLPRVAVAASAAAGPLSAAAPTAAPATFRKSRRVKRIDRRSSRISATERPERSASSKSAKSVWNLLSSGLRAIDTSSFQKAGLPVYGRPSSKMPSSGSRNRDRGDHLVLVMGRRSPNVHLANFQDTDMEGHVKSTPVVEQPAGRWLGAQPRAGTDDGNHPDIRGSAKLLPQSSETSPPSRLGLIGASWLSQSVLEDSRRELPTATAPRTSGESSCTRLHALADGPDEAGELTTHRSYRLGSTDAAIEVP